MNKSYIVYDNGFIEDVFSSLDSAIDYAESVCNSTIDVIIMEQDDGEEVMEYIYNRENLRK